MGRKQKKAEREYEEFIKYKGEGRRVHRGTKVSLAFPSAPKLCRICLFTCTNAFFFFPGVIFIPIQNNLKAFLFIRIKKSIRKR